MKKFLCLLIGMFILTTSPVYAENEKVNVIVNGYSLESNIAEIVDGRTFVPLREISEKLGAKVQYNHDKDKEILIEKDNKKIVLHVGKVEVKVDNKESKLDTKPYIKEDKTMVPVRFVSETLGEKVDWDEKSKSAIIGSISGKAPGKDDIGLELKCINGKVFLPKDYTKEIFITTKALNEGDVTVISKKVEKNNDNSNSGVLFVLNNSRKPILDKNNGLNLHYSSDTENFITLTHPGAESFPKEIRGDMLKLQEKYMEMFKTYKPLPLENNMATLKWNKGTEKTWDTLTVLKNMFLPRDYFYYNIPYTMKNEDIDLVYLSNLNGDGSVSSKVEMDFNSEQKLTRFHIKFYDGEKDLVKKPYTIEEAKKNIKLFQELVLNYPKDKLPELTLSSNSVPNMYEKGIHEVFKDKDNNKFVFNLESGILEYFTAE